MRKLKLSAALTAGVAALLCAASLAFASTTTVALTPGNGATVTCSGTKLTSTKQSSTKYALACSGSTTTTTSTTTSTTTTTTQPSGGGSCTNPVFTTSDAEGTYDIDPSDGEYWWVNNDAWSGSHGPQTLYVCNQSSWYATSNQPNDGGAVETYPDTEYFVGGAGPNGAKSTTPLSAYSSITSTFSESYPSAGGWDAAYDLWLNNWSIETMIWNQWAGSQAYWFTQTNTVVTLGGVQYKFLNNGGEYVFLRVNQVSSGSVDILAAYQYLISQGLVKSSDVPTQLEYGVEVCYTNGTETFPMNGLTFNLQGA